MRLSTKLPDEMSANERLKEIASILAKALSRDNQDDANILKNLDNKRGLTGLPVPSKHSCSNNKKFSKHKGNEGVRHED